MPTNITHRDFQSAFELEATSQYGAIGDKPSSAEMEYWINQGIREWVKVRYSGLNYKVKSYERDQKRVDDLRLPTKPITLFPSSSTKNEFTFTLPDDYVFRVGTKPYIYPNTDNPDIAKCWDMDKNGNYVHHETVFIECTHDNIDERLTNSLSDHLYHGSKTRPLYTMIGNSIIARSDGNYTVSKIDLKYLTFPEDVKLIEKPKELYTAIPIHAFDEVIKIAVRMYIENKSKERYNTFSNEVNIME